MKHSMLKYLGVSSKRLASRPTVLIRKMIGLTAIVVIYSAELNRRTQALLLMRYVLTSSTTFAFASSDDL